MAGLDFEHSEPSVQSGAFSALADLALALFVFLAESNATNLTDGLDGLHPVAELWCSPG